MAGEGSQWPSERVKAACLQVPLQLESGILAPPDPSTKLMLGRGCSTSEWLPSALQPGLGWEFPSWKKRNLFSEHLNRIQLNQQIGLDP